jgi:hypothetical protein
VSPRIAMFLGPKEREIYIERDQRLFGLLKKIFANTNADLL